MNYQSIDDPLGFDIDFEGLPATEEELAAKRPQAEESVPVG